MVGHHSWHSLEQRSAWWTPTRMCCGNKCKRSTCTHQIHKNFEGKKPKISATNNNRRPITNPLRSRGNRFEHKLLIHLFERFVDWVNHRSVCPSYRAAVFVVVVKAKPVFLVVINCLFRSACNIGFLTCRSWYLRTWIAVSSHRLDQNAYYFRSAAFDSMSKRKVHFSNQIFKWTFLVSKRKRFFV